MVWNLFPFKGDFSFGKSWKLLGNQIWTVQRLSHLGDLMFHQNLCMGCDAWAGTLSWWSCQSLVAQSCGFLNHVNSFLGGMSKLNTKFDAVSLLYSLSHFECDGHTVHMLTQWHLPPHWLVQRSHHCSCMSIPVHFPWLPGYIDGPQTILIILTVVGLFPDRPQYIYLCLRLYLS